MALEMKYFVLKPRSKGYGDRFAKASRAAMVKFADEINDIDPDLAWELKLWVEREERGELNRFYTLKYPWHPTESDMRPPLSTTGHAHDLEPEAYAKWLGKEKKS